MIYVWNVIFIDDDAIEIMSFSICSYISVTNKIVFVEI